MKYATDITAQAVARQKAERARGLIESVAAGSEEMSASIREISQTMTKSKETAAMATDRVEAADQQALKLNAAAQAMSGIVQLIGDITGQINLLALNATIESARAGEAGRGFAVVASEVKNLANQAKQATDTISGEIEALNSVASDVVGSLVAIKTAIGSVNEFITSTAAASKSRASSPATCPRICSAPPLNWLPDGKSPNRTCALRPWLRRTSEASAATPIGRCGVVCSARALRTIPRNAL